MAPVPLLASTIILTFTLANLVTVRPSAGPIILVMVTILTNRLLWVKNRGAPLLMVTPLFNRRSVLLPTLPVVTSWWPLVRYALPLTRFIRFRLGTRPKLLIGRKERLVPLVLVITVLVSGRLDTPLSEVVTRSSLPRGMFLP